MASPRFPSPLVAGTAVAVVGLLLGLAILAVAGRWSEPVSLPPNPDAGRSGWTAPLGPRDITPEDPPFLVSSLPLDLGTVAPGGIAAGRLTIVNSRRRPLEILAIRPLCSCLSITGGDSSAAVAPGETRTIDIRMESPDQPRQAETKKIRILSRGHDPMDVAIRVATSGPDDG